MHDLTDIVYEASLAIVALTMSQVNDWQSVYQWKADGRAEQRIMYVSHTYNPIASTRGDIKRTVQQ